MRRLLAILLLALAILLAGCQRSVRVPRGRTLVVVWSGWTGAEQDFFESVVAAYNTSQDRIWVENMSTEQDDGKVMRALTAGVPPDCFFLWEPSYIGALAQINALQPLDGYIADTKLDLGALVPASIAMTWYRGHYYAMPFMIDCSAFYWSKKAFRSVGLDPERPPRTLSELEAYTRRLTAWEPNGRLRRVGFEMPGFTTATSLFGGHFFDPKTNRVTADDPRNLEAMRWYHHLFQIQGGAQRIDSFSQGYGNFDSPNHQFFTGKVAMMISGEWWTAYCKRYRPDMDFGVSQIPYPDHHPEMVEPTAVGGNFVCIPREAKHPREAWDFLRYLQSDEAQVLFASKIRNVPNTRAAIKSPVLRTGDRWAVAFGQVCDMALSKNASYFPALPINLLYYNELDTAAQYIARGTKTPEQALADVQRRVQKELETFPEYRPR